MFMQLEIWISSSKLNPNVYQHIEATVEARWTLMELAFHAKTPLENSPARSAALKILNTPLRHDIRSLSDGDACDLQYPQLWIGVFSNLPILDTAGFRWLVRTCSPILFTSQRTPEIISQGLNEHITARALSLTVETLKTLIEAEKATTLDIIRMLFSGDWHLSGAVEQLFLHTYDCQENPRVLAAELWPKLVVEAAKTAIDALPTAKSYAESKSSIGQLLDIVARCKDTSKCSKSLLKMIIRFLEEPEDTSHTTSDLILKVHCHFEDSDNLSFGHTLDDRLRDIYSQVPEHPAKHLLARLDRKVGYALKLDEPPRYQEGCAGVPAWMQDRHEAGMVLVREEQERVKQEVKGYIANFKATNGGQPQEPREWPFGPPPLRRMYITVLKLAHGSPLEGLPESDSRSDKIGYYQWHLAVELYHSIKPKLPFNKTTHPSKPFQCRARLQIHKHNDSWADLSLTTRRGPTSTIVWVVQPARQEGCYGIMRQTLMSLSVAIPKRFERIFQGEDASDFEGLLVDVYVIDR